MYNIKTFETTNIEVISCQLNHITLYIPDWKKTHFFVNKRIIPEKVMKAVNGGQRNFKARVNMAAIYSSELLMHDWEIPACKKRQGIAPGLYEVIWKNGDSSLAAVGIDVDGTNWLAPVDWISSVSDLWDNVKEILRIETDE